MHWLILNYQWVFSGIGVLIVGYFIQRRSKSDQTNIEVKDSSLAGPIVSGSGNTQTINAPTIHAENVHFGPSETKPAEEEIERPRATIQRANIQLHSAGIVDIREIARGMFSQGRDGHRDYFQSAIAEFSNDAIPGIENREAAVKATIIYRDGPREVKRVVGNWLEYGSGEIRFRVDDSHKLIIVLIFDKHLCVLEKEQVQAHRRTFWNTSLQRLALDKFTATVRLIGVSTGYCYFESEFEVHTHPLNIKTLF